MSRLSTISCVASLGLVLAAGCSGGGGQGDPPDAQAATGPRFYEDVSPLLMEHCVSCHRDGGAAPFPLITYEDAVTVAAVIPEMVITRQMPPWGADNSGTCNTYQGARWLDDAEIATIADWARGDRRAGDPAAALPPPPPPPGLARVDATADMAEPYVADQTLADDYRCFIVDPGLAADAYLTGFEVRPGEPTVVHHMLLFQLNNANAEATAAALDAQAPGPGYTCFGGPGAAASLIGVWAPGIRVANYPAGTGLALEGGRKMVIQIHYHTDAGPLPDQTAVDLMIEPTVPDPAFLFPVADLNLYLPPQQSSVTVTSQLPLPGFLPQYNVWGVFPHMHTLGRKLRVEVDRAGATQCLGDVPRWDFNWQQGYFYDAPPHHVGGGDTLRISCTYDTSQRQAPVTWGEGTEDEMCLAFLFVSPRTDVIGG